MHTERTDRLTSPSLRDWSNNKFSYYLSDATGYIHIQYVRSLTIPSIWTQLSHGILRLYWWRGQERIPPIPLELLSCDLVLGVHSASATSKLKKRINTYMNETQQKSWCNKMKLWILLLTHFILSFRVAPLIFQSCFVDELAHVVSTVIIPLFLPQALYDK